jgi:polyhydroxybutyrate depolymerase
MIGRVLQIALLAVSPLVCGASYSANEAQGSVQSGGETRTFSVTAPTGAGPYPIVVALHGGGSTGKRMAMITGLDQYVDRDGFIAVYPDAGRRPWNDGRETTSGFSDDVAALRAIVQTVAQTYNGDPRRVFVTGISAGGMMVQRLACDASDLFRAYAAVVGDLPSALSGRCNPSRPVPMMLFYGTADRLMPFAGGDLPQLAGQRNGAGLGGRVLSAPDSVQFWVRKNGCGGESAETLPDRKDDGTQVIVHRFAGCNSGSQVVFYEIQGGGHNWPGGPSPKRPMLQRLIGNVSQDIDATSIVLGFFKQYGL